MISTLIDDQNVNIIHYCAKNGYLPAVHMLLTISTDLDLLDKDQYTPLMVAVLAFKNDVVKYLIKAGVSISFKVRISFKLKKKIVFLERIYF